MIIVHTCLASPFHEGLGYQENYLTKKHVELGFDTYVLSYHPDNSEGTQYKNQNGVNVVYLPINRNYYLKPTGIIQICNNYLTHKIIGVYDTLAKIKPDVIFIHAPQTLDNLAVCKYKRLHPNTKIYCDNHGDFYNMPVNSISNKLTQKLYFKFIAKKIEKASEMMWGVTPWRVEYLQKVYDIKPEHTGLLVMGGDEQFVDFERKGRIKEEVRKRYGIPKTDFLVVTGGKIDKTKNIHLLIDAFKQIDKNISLLVFGKINEEMSYLAEEIKSISNVYYAGWMDSNSVYQLFMASDLAIFPGTHSVLWEQACASGIPCVFKDWGEMMHHVDIGGNAIFLKEISQDSLRNVINELSEPDSAAFKQMRSVAENKARKAFSYLEIAKKAIGL